MKIFKIQDFLLKTENTSLESIKKQEAHGPHRSPEKTVQIDKHI